MKIRTFIALLVPTAAFASHSDWDRKITPADAAKLVADGKAVLVDVREPKEWAKTGVAVPAVLLPFSDFEHAREEWRPFLEKNAGKEIVLYGHGGHDVSNIIAVLRKKGLHLWDAGAFEKWVAAGLPVRKVEAAK